jgi:hypothetical protein
VKSWAKVGRSLQTSRGPQYYAACVDATPYHQYFFQRWIVSCCLFLIFTSPLWPAEKITAVDADGIERVLNKPGWISVIIYSNESLQDWTREAGKALDEFQGMEDFRAMVVVDLRSSLALFAKGYTQRRMQRDLDKEAERVRPYYEKNGSTRNPRDGMMAIADFHGETCEALGWEDKARDKRIIIFTREGKKGKSWESIKDFKELKSGVRSLLQSGEVSSTS